MKFIELKQDLSANVRNIYLLEGEDAYFRQSAEAQIKAKYLTVAELNYSAYDGTAYKGASYTEITSALSAFPFMAEYRVVKISEFYPTESD